MSDTMNGGDLRTNSLFVAIACLYLAPMYLVGHWHGYALICLGFAAAAVVALKFTWYDNLPE